VAGFVETPGSFTGPWSTPSLGRGIQSEGSNAGLYSPKARRDTEQGTSSMPTAWCSGACARSCSRTARQAKADLRSATSTPVTTSWSSTQQSRAHQGQGGQTRECTATASIRWSEDESYRELLGRRTGRSRFPSQHPRACFRRVRSVGQMIKKLKVLRRAPKIARSKHPSSPIAMRPRPAEREGNRHMAHQTDHQTNWPSQRGRRPAPLAPRPPARTRSRARRSTAYVPRPLQRMNVTERSRTERRTKTTSMRTMHAWWHQRP